VRNASQRAWPTPDELSTLSDRLCHEDSAAEDVFVRLFGPRIRIVALARTRDPEAARELTQDILMAALSGVRKGLLREGGRLAAFVYGIARNQINNHFRVLRRRPDERPVEEADAVYDPAEAIEHGERMARVRRALSLLSAGDRRILLLTLVDGLKPTDIATRLGLSSEVVRARKSRALKKIMDHVRSLSRL